MTDPSNISPEQQAYYQQQQQAYYQQQAGAGQPPMAYDPNQQAAMGQMPAGYDQQQVVYDPSYYQPPPQQTGTSYSDYNYSYDAVNYQYMTVDQWYQVPVDQSPYSDYWASPEVFEPEKFKENTKKETKYYDMGWTIAFFVNLAITAAVLVIILLMEIPQHPTTPANELSLASTTFTTDDIIDAFINSIWVGILVAILTSLLHFVYMTLAPGFYIKFGFFVVFILVLAFCLIPLFFGVPYFLIFAGLIGVILLIVYCCIKKYIPMSIAVLAKTCDILWSHPAIFLVTLLQLFINLVVCCFYSFIVYEIVIKEVHYAVYIYVFFSFVWFNYCMYYVLYTTIVGVAGTVYFLEGTPEMPSSPVWTSFKRACTTSFGSCALASFLVAVIKTLRKLAEDGDRSSGGSILACIAICILACIEAIFKWITKYALIYCGIFGVPFIEGCRRFIELESKKFVSVLIGGSIVGTALGMNLLAFVVIAAAMGALMALMMDDNIFGYVFYILFSIVFTLDFFTVLESPIDAISDALFICYAEHPKRLHVFAEELSVSFSGVYDEELKQLLGKKAKKPKKNKK